MIFKTILPIPEHFLNKNKISDKDFFQLFQKLINRADEDLKLEETRELFLTPSDFGRKFGRRRVNIALGREAGSRIFRLALIYYFTQEIRYLRACFDFMERYLERDWTEGEGDLSSAYWLKGYILTFNLLKDDKNFIKLIRNTNLSIKLKRQAERCCSYLSNFIRYGYDLKPKAGGNDVLNNNHNVIAASTLGLTSLFLGRKKDDPWFKQAKEIIDDYLFLSDKLGEDGDWFENTPFYQFFWLYFFLPFADACRYLKIYDYLSHPKIRKAFEVFFFYCTPDGGWIGINDGKHEESFNLIPLLLKAACEYQDGKFLWLIERIDKNFKKCSLAPILEDVIYYYDFLRLPEIQKPDLPLDKYLRRTGVVISRSSWERKANFFVFNCGPVESHSHLDKGTFEFYYHGKPIMVDSGVGSYVERYKWISPSMHNVVVADGGVKFEIIGEGWSNTKIPYCGKINCFLPSKEFTYVEGSYASFASVKKANRGILFSKTGYLIILDELADNSPRIFHAYFHGIGKLKVSNDTAIWTKGKNSQTILKIVIPKKFNFRQGIHPVSGWSDIKEQEFVDIRSEGKRVRYLSVITVREPNNKENLLLKAFSRKGMEVIEIHGQGIKDTWISQEKQKESMWQDIVTDAKITFIREKRGKIRGWLARDGNRVCYKGKELLSGVSCKNKSFRGFKKRTFICNIAL